MSISPSRVDDGPGDAELISAVRGGDVEAYGELFARHVDAARRLARQLAGPGDSDDLVSDAFAKVLTVLQRGGGPDLAFRAYLLTAVRRLHVDRLRSGSRLRPVDDLSPFDPGLPFHDTAVEGFENAAAARAFASLPERWQMVLWHTEVEQQKPADIAPLLGMSANSVSALAYRAREGLRQAFLSQHAADEDDVDCAWTRDHLGAYVRGGLSRRDAARVDDHIAACRGCAAVYLELTEVNSGLGALLAPLLLGSAGVGYLSSTSGSGSTAATGFTAAKAWAATHASLSAVGGVALTATAVVAVYAASHLGGHGVSTTGAPPPPQHVATSSSHHPSTDAGHHGRGPHQHRVTRVHRHRGPGVAPLPGTTDTAVGPSIAQDPSVGPTSGTTSGPTGAPTSPTTGPTSQPTSEPTTPPTTQPTTRPPTPITFTSNPPTDPAIGSSYEVGVTGGSGKPITVTVDPTTTNASCTMAGATTVRFDHAGTCVLVARESGTRAPGARATAPVTQTIVVPQTPQTVTIDSSVPADPRVDGSYTVSATSSSGRAVTLAVVAPTDACALSGSTVSFHHVGTCVVTATQAGNADLAQATASQTITVARGVQTITFSSQPPSPAYVGHAYDASATGGGSGNEVTFGSGTPAVCTVEGSTVTFKAAGTCTVAATQAASSDYDAASASQDVIVTNEFDLAVTAAPGDQNGQDQRVTVIVSGMPASGVATLTVDGPDDLHQVAGAPCPCIATGATTMFTFAFNIQQTPNATLTFTVSTLDSSIDPVSTNDTAVLQFPVAAPRTFAPRLQD